MRRTEMVSGNLEITIKIKELPEVETVQNGWQQFHVNCNGTVFTITVRPKLWRKFEEAQAAYPQWVAAIKGKLGQRTSEGFVLDEAGIQVFEKKVKGESVGEGGER
jgi:hypothetical protein